MLSLSPDQAFKAVHRFPNYKRGGTFTKAGSFPSALAAGPDGAIYGVTAAHAAFGCGSLFKIDRKGRFSELHHFSSLVRSDALLVSESGDIFAGTDDGVLCLGKDSVQTALPGVIGHPLHLCETTERTIILASVTYQEDEHGFLHPGGAIMRLNEETSRFELIADLGMPPMALVPTPDGGVLTLTSTRILKFSGVGEMTVLHDYSQDQYPFSILQPNFITVARDGSYIGSATGLAEGLNVAFRIGPRNNPYSVVRTFSATGDEVLEQWLENVFPLRVATENGNHPPSAVDDIVSATTFKLNSTGLPEKTIPVLKNDVDIDRDRLIIVAVSQPAHGTVAFDFVSQRVTYTANSTAVENDTFTYTVVDGSGGTVTGHVAIRTPQSGRYRGEIRSLPDTAHGDPGTLVGNLSVKVNGQRQVSARVDFQGKTYRFTAPLNEINRCATVLSYDHRSNIGVGIELSLRPSGQNWIVDAVVGRMEYLYYASCPLEPRTP